MFYEIITSLACFFFAGTPGDAGAKGEMMNICLLSQENLCLIKIVQDYQSVSSETSSNSH